MNLINEYIFGILTKYLLYFLRMMVESSRSNLFLKQEVQGKNLSSLELFLSCTIFYNINKIDVKGARKWKESMEMLFLHWYVKLKRKVTKKVETCYNIRIVWVLYEILKKNLEVLYDDVTKAFEIRSNEFYVLTSSCVVFKQAASFEKEIKDFIAEVDEEIEELELIELRGQP
jgi:hypothetical protein